MRCSHDMVVAVTDTGEALFWGLGGPPRLVQPDCDFHREMFSLGEMPDSGGTVFLEWSPGKLFQRLTNRMAAIFQTAFSSAFLNEIHVHFESKFS